MNWTILYNTANNGFVALTDAYSDPPPSGIAAKTVGAEKPDLDLYTWDPSSLTLVPRVPARIVFKYVFILRFTDSERRAFFSFPMDSSKTETQRKNVSAFMWYLLYLDMINLDDQSIVDGVNYLETVGILAAGRAAQILG